MRFTVALIGFAGMALAAPEEDRVTYLPEMGYFDKYAVYSGYVDIPATGKKSLHYMFLHSQNAPSTDPLIIWFNGGPGCSSMLGWAQEHGPFVVPDGGQTFVENPYSWNREANMLYVESPAGVGYSYGETEADRTFDDNTSAQDNLNFILGWFEKFPEFKSHDLYISGESYAGIYVPYASYYIDQYNVQHAADDTVFKPNLKGFMVGNGVTDWTYDTTPAFVQLAYDEVLLEDSIMNKIQKLGCNYGTNHPFDGISAACKAALLDVMNATSGINTYNTYGICYGAEPFPQLKGMSHGVSVVNGMEKHFKRHYTAADYTPWMFEGVKEANGSIPPCIYGTPVADYFNRADIRALLHVPDYVQAWELCTGNINYTTGAEASLWIY
jgi:hypothetical protein